MILFQNVSVRYPDSPRNVVSGIQLHIKRGETVLLLGPSGCGKSTLVLCINGLIPQRMDGELEGQVQLDGWDTATTPFEQLAPQVGFIFQDPGGQLVAETIEEEVAFSLENLELPEEEIRKRVQEILLQVGLWHRRAESPAFLSGGEQQRLALAAVLGMSPPVLVLDEPTSALDSTSTQEMIQWLQTLRREQPEQTVVIIEHKLQAWLPWVDRVVVLTAEGKLLLDGLPEEIFTQHSLRLQELGIWAPTAMPSLSCFPKKKAAFVSSPLALEIKNLSYQIAGRWILRDVQLQVQRGNFMALVGENGAGKTSLLRHLIQDPMPTKETVYVNGQDLTKLSLQRLSNMIGYAWQNPEHSFIAETVFDELAFGLRCRGDSEKEIQDRILPLLLQFGLASQAAKHPFMLSYGQKRRLAIAVLLLMEPDLLLLDEPTLGLDYQNTQFLFRELHAFCKRGKTILWVSHDMELVDQHADRIVRLEQGRMSCS